MTETTKTELQELKEQADALGIVYPNNITLAKLKALVNAAATEEDPAEVRRQHEAEQLKLLKVLITPVDSAKRDWEGEIFSVGNDVLGTVSRYVPFNQEWFVEAVLVRHIKQREFQYLQHKKDKATGRDYVDSKLVPAFNVQELPLPTPEEIAEMAKIQAVKEA